MGVNVNVMFPRGTRMRDVETAAAILLGCEKKWEEKYGARWVETPGTSRTTTSIPEMAYINIPVSLSKNPAAVAIQKSDGDTYAMSYHFESKHGGPLITPKSTASKIALCKALVDFFGGKVDFNDCDSVRINYRKPARRPIAPTNGKAWNDFQQSLDNIKPLTEKNIKAVAKWAAY